MPVSLTVEQFEAIRAIDSPTIANAIEPFNVRPHASGYVGHDIRCLVPGLGTMLGYAVTCTADSRTEWRRREDSSFLDLCRVVQAAPKPAVVVIQDVGQDRDRSCHVGEVMATTFKRLGAVGVVTDGGLRDIVEVRELGDFHYYGAGLVVAHGRPMILDVNVEVTISGMPVTPGALLHGDENGIVHIPDEIADQVVAEAGRIREYEAERLRVVNSPDFMLEGYR